MDRTRGFTLIEMVIVMAIAAIIGALAVPAYSDHVLRSRATAAASVLKDLRLRMEQRYADDRSYAPASDTARCSVANFLDPDSGFSFVCVPGAGGQSYTWTATGAAATAGFTYSIDEAGLERTVALPARWKSAGLTLPVTRFITRRGG